MFHEDHLKGQLYENLPASRQLFQCQDCGKQYNTQLGYRRHLVAAHSAAAGPLCMESPAMLETLGEHGDRPLSTDGGTGVPPRERKYSCERCDRRFYTRKDVRRHAVVHTGRRDFLCPCCAQRFGRRDHLTRHLKKSHAQESGLMPASNPGNHGTAQTLVKEEPPLEAPVRSSASKDPSEGFTREMSTSYSLPNLIPAMAPPHGLVQVSLSSSMGVGHHMTTPSSHPHRHALQPPAVAQQQPYGGMSQYPYGSTSYPRSDMDGFLLDFQNIPSSQLSEAGSSMAASPQKEIVGDGVDGGGGETHPVPRSPAVSTAEPPCNTNMDLGSLLSFLPFGLPPYNPHMGLVMSYPPAPSPTSSPSSTSGVPGQAPGPFSFLQPPQAHGPQGSGVFNPNQLPQSYSPAVSSSSSLPHYYQAFQQ